MTSMTLVEEELHLRSADGTALFVRRVRPEKGVRARLAWVHGVAEHGARYLPTLRWLAERGFHSSIVDLRGHGNSGGRRVHVSRFGEYSDDMEAHLSWVREDLGDEPAPLFALGHSMGALVLTRTLQDRLERLPALKGAVLFSPFFGVEMKLPAWKVLAGRTLTRVLPWFALPTDLDVSLLSKDPGVGEAYESDPRISKKVTARWFSEVMAAHPLALEGAARMALPLLLMHGEQDGLASPAAAKEFFGRLGSEDKELELWDGLRHELLNEVEKEQVRERLLGWLEARL